MMKKLLLIGSVVFAFSFGAQAQGHRWTDVTTDGPGHWTQGNSGLKIASTNTFEIFDTLHYYFNKFYFKTAISQYSLFPFYKSSAATGTNVTHCGSRFDVPPGETVIVTGLEAFAKRRTPAVNLNIPVKMMLCNLDAAGMPMLPPIDSLITTVTGTAVSTIGGTLTAPRTMTASFAILFRNFSTFAGDTAQLLRTAGTTETNSASPANTKYSDRENGKGYGFVRFKGVFYSTTDFNLAPGFGVGTAYEFVVAPRVTYTLQASQTLPAGVVASDDVVNVADTPCTRQLLLFTNTSSAFYEHRQYNLNQFYKKWSLASPFPPSVNNAFSSDSSITWHFEFYDVEQPPRDSRVFLPYVNNHTITATTGLSYYPQCFTANQFRARLKPMSAFGRISQYNFNQDFIVCNRYCNDDAVGIKDLSGYDNLKVYPNPAVNGKTLISGLEGKNTVVVYGMLGQVISSELTSDSTLEIDLARQPKGTFIVRIVNSNSQTKIVKIVNPN